MGLFDKIKGPVFLKDNSDAERHLEILKELQKTAAGENAEAVEKQIRLTEAGIVGEKQVRFELETSHIPMYVIHDLYLEHDGLSAQIDYLIITRKRQFVIECKNLYGDIEINSSGDFIRTLTYGRHTKKEGIYSPITQNRRHMELIKQIRGGDRGAIARVLFEKNFFNNYRSVVVLSNPKTVLNAKYAKKEVRDQVIRADQLAEYIRKVNAEPEAVASSEKDMEALAQYFMGISKQPNVDYTEKLRINVETASRAQPAQVEVLPAAEEVKTPDPKSSAGDVVCPRCGAAMVRRKATKGANADKEFFGCSTYPKCRGIISIP